MRQEIFDRMLHRFLTAEADMLRTATPRAHVTADPRDFSPPDPYALPKIAERRRADETPEERYRAERRAAFAAEYAAFDALLQASPPMRLTAAEIASYAPPDPYERDQNRARRNG